MKQRVMAMNLRVNTPVDGDNAWPYRIQSAAAVFNYHQPDIAGTQEGLFSMLNELSEQLPDYGWIGEGRDGDHADEHSAVFYRKSTVEIVNWGQFWLSEMPERPSTSWQSACPRICTWVDFKMIANPDVIFTLFNTHLDHISQTAREEGARLIYRRIQERMKSGHSRVILTGDMNAEPSNPVIRFFRGEDELLGETSTLHDAYLRLAGPAPATFHSFGDASESGPIDYIFVSEGIEIESITVDQSTYLGRYPTDHFPVISTLKV